MSEMIHWKPASESSGLAQGDLHLWRIWTDERGLDVAWGLTLLDEPQRERMQRMRHVIHRDRYVRAHAGLRLILASYVSVPAQSICFERGSAGKPSLHPDLPVLSFNLTTSGDLALVGLCAGAESESQLGVDCEWMRPRIEIEAVAARMFEPDALAQLAATPESERLETFYRYWTALEADAKSDGRGLFRPRAPEATPPTIMHCIPEPGYLAAVARARLPPLAQWQTFALEPACAGFHSA